MGINTLQDNIEQKEGEDNISFNEREYNSQLFEIKKEKKEQMNMQKKNLKIKCKN